MTHETRESWLNAVAQGMALLFEALDAPLPDRVRVAIGFTSRGAKGKAIGECWDCLLYTSPSPRDYAASRMPSSA